MTENGDPLENAIAERVNGNLKQKLLEEVFSCFEAAQKPLLLLVVLTITFARTAVLTT